MSSTAKNQLPLYAPAVKASIGLTPILEDFEELQLSSKKKRSNDDLQLLRLSGFFASAEQCASPAVASGNVTPR